MGPCSIQRVASPPAIADVESSRCTYRCCGGTTSSSLRTGSLRSMLLGARSPFAVDAVGPMAPAPLHGGFKCSCYAEGRKVHAGLCARTSLPACSEYSFYSCEGIVVALRVRASLATKVFYSSMRCPAVYSLIPLCGRARGTSSSHRCAVPPTGKRIVD